MILQVFDLNLNLITELTIYRSLQMTRSFGGVGRIELHSHPKAPNVSLISENSIIMPVGKPEKAFLIEDIDIENEKFLARGCQLKGLAKRRLCVPPLNLPKKLWKYTQGAWVEISDKNLIKQYLSEDIMQGYEKPLQVTEGLLWLDMKDMAAVYNWDKKPQYGEVWLDLERAQLRSKYKNFGYDRFTGSGESAIKHFAKNNLIDPEDSARKMPSMECEPDENRGQVLPWQARFDKLEDVLENITNVTGIGWDIVPDITNKKFIFRAMQGEDLSDEIGRQKVTISVDMGNAKDVSLSKVSSRYGNVAYTGGEGEDEERLILAVADGEISEGFDRREIWAESGAKEDIKLVRMSGLKKLKEASSKITLKADVLDGGPARYEKDWNLGDIVRVIFNEGGIKAEASLRVNEVRETIEVDKPRKLQVTFGDAPITINSLVKSYSREIVR